MCADSSAVVANAKRRSAGKLRHGHIGLLWIQAEAEDEEDAVKEVNGISNQLDMMTTPVNIEELEQYRFFYDETENARSRSEGRIEGEEGSES